MKWPVGNWIQIGVPMCITISWPYQMGVFVGSGPKWSAATPCKNKVLSFRCYTHTHIYIYTYVWHSIWHIYIYVHIFLDSIWHPNRPLMWHSIWHSIDYFKFTCLSTWHSIRNAFWHSIWHIYVKLYTIYSDILFGILSGISFWHLSDILFDILSGMCSGLCVPKLIRSSP